MHSTHRFEIFADYFQFIVQDEGCTDDFAAIWTPEALEMAAAFGRGSVCPGTLRNVEVPVDIQLWDRDPKVFLEAVDHAVEGSIEVQSGTLVVMGCTGYFPDAPRIQVEPQTYNVLVTMGGVASIKTEWEPAADIYSVYLWPGAIRLPKLLKHWKGNA